MKQFLYAFAFTFFTLFTLTAQEIPQKKITVTGKISEKGTNLPLEYATISFQHTQKKQLLTGAITNEKGLFTLELPTGIYDVTAEYISFKSVVLKNQSITENVSLNTIYLEPDAQQLKEVEIVIDRPSVEIKLDKKVYNVGADMIVKGGTISDVLDNVPSVAVDSDGSVTLRGNGNVRILIDGKPSGMAGITIADALKALPADSVDKVEVITNPSARYDAEGGAGIINIILKKGKTNGLNGSVLLTTGAPDNHTFSTNINYKTKKYNLFTTQGYGIRNSPGNYLANTQYFNPDGTTKNYINERRHFDKYNNGYNGSLGLELYLTESSSWTNAFNYRQNTGKSPDQVYYYDYDANNTATSIRSRLNTQNTTSENIEYITSYVKRFKKEDHKLTFDASISKNTDTNNAIITQRSLTGNTANVDEKTKNDQTQNRYLLQTDYVLPFGKNSKFEMGYRGNFTELITDYQVDSLGNSGYVTNYNFTNKLQYKENINALYSQVGSKINKISYLFGLRWEDSNITINQLTTQSFNTKKYNNFFPSVFLTYEFSETSNFSVNYSRRITRPRDRFINPFSEYSSNINYFQGNPNINPAISNVYDIGYLKKWTKLTFNASAYYNNTTSSFQVIQRESGQFINTVIDGQDIKDANGNVITVVGGADLKTPVVVFTPVNIGFTDKIGFEFTLNYSPYKWWKLSGNYNFFRNQTNGSYTYTNSLTNKEITQRFDNIAFSWFTRVNSKVSLPYGIDFQLNGTYNAPMATAQGNLRGVLSGNLALSKDILKDKGTLAFTINDIFNSRKRLQDTNLAGILNSYREMQFRERQITLSFTYRFNKKKNEREKQPQGGGNGGGGEEF